MPLASGKATLANGLYNAWLDGKTEKTVPIWARTVSNLILNFVLTGKPMTVITTFPGSVVGAQTSGPVKGKGLGGLDKPVPGMGLTAAKPILKQQLIQIWTHRNSVRDVRAVANETANAIYSYFSQAIIQTEDKTSGAVPCPPPAGPATGSTSGKGGVLSATPGKGYRAARPKLEADLIRIWNQVKEERTVEQFAAEVADAIHAFCIEGKIETSGTFVAPAAVAPPPAPPNGAYFPGVGTSTSGTLT